MQSRIEIFHFLIKTSENNSEFSYSSTLRQIRKKYPNKLFDFMKLFKEAFDEALLGKIDAAEQVALMQSIKSLGIKINETI